MFKGHNVDDYGDKKLRKVIFAAMWVASAASSGALLYAVFLVK